MSILGEISSKITELKKAGYEPKLISINYQAAIQLLKECFETNLLYVDTSETKLIKLLGLYVDTSLNVSNEQKFVIGV